MTPSQLPAPGTPAPDFTLLNTDGGPISLSDVWQQGPTAFVFLRHLGRVFRREQVAAPCRDYANVQDAGMQIACITQGDPQTGKALSRMRDMPLPLLLCGVDLSVYAASGL